MGSPVRRHAVLSGRAGRGGHHIRSFLEGRRRAHLQDPQCSYGKTTPAAPEKNSLSDTEKLEIFLPPLSRTEIVHPKTGGGS